MNDSRTQSVSLLTMPVNTGNNRTRGLTLTLAKVALLLPQTTHMALITFLFMVP